MLNVVFAERALLRQGLKEGVTRDAPPQLKTTASAARRLAPQKLSNPRLERRHARGMGRLYTEWGVAMISLVGIVGLLASSLITKRTRAIRAIQTVCALQLASFAGLSAYANVARWPSPSEAYLPELRLAPLDGRPCCIRSGTAARTRRDAPATVVPPIPFPKSARTLDEALAAARGVILGGRLRRPHRIASLVAERALDATHAYAHYAFRIGLFRFVDDVELLFDSAARQIHFRSHLRVGQGDMDANADRMSALRYALATMPPGRTG